MTMANTSKGLKHFFYFCVCVLEEGGIIKEKNKTKQKKTTTQGAKLRSGFLEEMLCLEIYY